MPKLAELQNQFCANIRDPDSSQKLDGVDVERMQVYQELIYNNVEDALLTVFPICHQILPEEKWHQWVRDFFIEYQAQKPLYRHISEEFLQYLLSLPLEAKYPFLHELAHFEWIELALDNDAHSFDDLNIKITKNIADEVVQLSPLAWNLIYQYPVHEIDEDFQPTSVGEANTFIIAYRNSDDKLHFDVTDHFTHLILEACQENNRFTSTELLTNFAKQHQQDEQHVRTLGLEILQRLQQQDIVFTVKE